MTTDTPIFSVDRPLSWSALSSFEYDPAQWHRKYVLGYPSPDTPYTLFGKTVGERLATDPLFLPQVPRHSIFEHPLRATIADLPIIGYIDSYEPPSDSATPAFAEYKTGKKMWNQKRVDEHGQITMYYLMLYLTENIAPDELECALHWLPTKDTGDFSVSLIDEKRVESFHTTRTLRELLEFGTYIHKKHKEMLAYAKWREPMNEKKYQKDN